MAAGKSAKAAEMFKNIGNKIFLKIQHNTSIHDQILAFYSKSISAALIDSEDLAVAYGNRASLLLHWKKYEECLEDIERALKVTKQDHFRVKSYCRKAKCLLALGSMDSSRAAWEKAKLHLSKIEIEDEFVNKLSALVDKVWKDLEGKPVSISYLKFVF